MADDREQTGWVWQGEQDALADPERLKLEKLKRTRKRESVWKEDLPYEIVLYGKPIPMTPVEYCIVGFLSSKPYFAFSKPQIVAAAHESGFTDVTEENLPNHIRSIRGRLGFFSDMVQSVAYIGYRFRP